MSSNSGLPIQTPATLNLWFPVHRLSVWMSIPAHLHALRDNNYALVQNYTLIGAHANPKRE